MGQSQLGLDYSRLRPLLPDQRTPLGVVFGVSCMDSDTCELWYIVDGDGVLTKSGGVLHAETVTALRNGCFTRHLLVPHRVLKGFAFVDSVNPECTKSAVLVRGLSLKLKFHYDSYPLWYRDAG